MGKLAVSSFTRIFLRKRSATYGTVNSMAEPEQLDVVLPDANVLRFQSARDFVVQVYKFRF